MFYISPDGLHRIIGYFCRVTGGRDEKPVVIITCIDTFFISFSHASWPLSYLEQFALERDGLLQRGIPGLRLPQKMPGLLRHGNVSR